MWEDTGMGTIVDVKKAKSKIENIKTEPPEKIELETDEGQRIALSKMTLEIFNREVRNLAAGQPKFNSDDEVQIYYLNTNFDYYP